MAEAFIVGAVRTPVGTKKGALAGAHPADLGAHVLSSLVERTGVDPAAVEDVIMGCVSQVGPQALDLARTAWLSAGLPETTPGVTIDRQCGSSQQAVHFAAQGVMSGTQDVVIASGVENMGMVPMGSNVTFALENGLSIFGEGWAGRYGDQEISQFRGAQLMCEKWGYKRAELERFALESHQRAAAAQSAGRFDAEIAPYGDVALDEGVRPDTTLEKMAGLAPLREGWELTPAVASQVSVGAGAVLIASERAVTEYGLTPMARVVQLSLVGDDPVYMLTAPIPATRTALRKAGLGIDDIDVTEINEAFAPVPLAWIEELGADPATTNPNGGAIALGHPLGATGSVLLTKLVHELERSGGRYGLQTMCEGGGQANVTIIERL
ncbi:acetyl-CoA C-acetyltransferase [Lipingzhangella halophila]|uniref:Acetyl-CoA C-acetyltransferase n=1 Tax=Lipingzhangella halophila TaxID=1783352 RepID=A0A7W7RL93_9ACTN|nr:acetyl-CoA C-acetyltransferase [Lipingzhangella halophila]MBB4934059.1 acetyl-CoA C-acetyltransferase [Lipingzhangella halophila]